MDVHARKLGLQNSDHAMISVIISALNEGMMLHQTLASLQYLCEHPFEVIVVDDGSTDGSCDKLARGLAFPLTLARVNRIGIALARNYGASLAKGRILVFLDAHCFPNQGWLDNIAAIFSKHPRAILSAAILDPRLPSAIGAGAQLKDFLFRYDWLKPKETDVWEVPIVPGGCLSVQRDDFMYLGKFDTMRVFGLEDVEFSIRAWRSGFTLLATSQVMVRHLFREVAPYHKAWPDYIHNLLRTLKLHFSSNQRARVVSLLRNLPDYGNGRSLVNRIELKARKQFIDRIACRAVDDYLRSFPCNFI